MRATVADRARIHILEAVRLGLVPRVTRRLTGHERTMIRPGTVWVWEEGDLDRVDAMVWADKSRGDQHEALDRRQAVGRIPRRRRRLPRLHRVGPCSRYGRTH